MIDIEAIRRKVRLGEYSVRPDAVQHAFKESFSQNDMEHVVLHGRVVEEYPERGRCLIGGFITLGRETKAPLHVVCEYSDPEDVVDFVTAYIPDTRISLNRLELASITTCHCERSEAISFCRAGIASSLRSSQ